jgi:hypothetical protein
MSHGSDRWIPRAISILGLGLIVITLLLGFTWIMNPASHDAGGSADRACADVRGTAYQDCFERALSESDPLLPIGVLFGLLVVGCLMATAWPISSILNRKSGNADREPSAT